MAEAVAPAPAIQPAKRRLRLRCVTEASLVENPANPQAKVVLWKSAQPADFDASGQAGEASVTEPTKNQDPAPEALTKAAAALESLQKQVEAETAKRVELQKALDAVLEKQATQALTQEAREYGPPGLSLGEAVTVLRTLDKADASAAALLRKSWAATQALAKVAGAEQGEAGQPAEGPLAELAKAVQAEKARDGKLSDAQARVRVYLTNPDLAAAVRAA